MKHRLILKSLADLPAYVVNLAAAAPGHAMHTTKHILAPSMHAARRQFRETRRRSGEFIAAVRARTLTSPDNITSWPRGGINE